MGQEIMDKILEVIYENPEKKFVVRELEKLSGVPKSTAHKILNDLKSEGLIEKDNSPSNNLLFKTKKTNYFVEKVIKSGLIDYTIKELNPSCIILFGSFRKGESNKESDIDLFVESHVKKKLNIALFEKKLKHKIELFIEKNINSIDKNLFNNVVNGIKLYGVFKVK